MRRRWRASASGLVVLAIASALSTAYLLRDLEPRMVSRRSTLSAVREGAPSVDRGYVLTPVQLTASSGLSLDLLVRRSVLDVDRSLPLVIVLGGHLTGRDAARLLGETRGVVVAALSYPFAGDPKPDALTFLRQIPEMRGAILDTPPAIMVALDYLIEMPGVDRARVEGVGVSLGAPFICIAAALDERITRVWSIHGSAGSFVPIEANLRRRIRFPPARFVAAGIANLLISGPRLDPMRWAPRVSPRPMIMVNAQGDERLPRSGVDLLHRSARDPKEIIWVAGGHVRPDSGAIRPILNLVMTRVRGAEPP